MREVYKLTLILKKYFNINFVRITLIARTVPALIKVRTVCLSEAATGYAGKAEAASDEKRIRRFLKDFPIDKEAIVRFITSDLPEGQRILTTDRTFREFGRLKIDILMSAVVHKGVAVPLLRQFPGEPDSGRKGNSDTGERIRLMTRFIRLFGRVSVNSSAVNGPAGSAPGESESLSVSGKIGILQIRKELPGRAVFCSVI